jgi:hypothetical protein
MSTENLELAHQTFAFTDRLIGQVAAAPAIREFNSCAYFVLVFAQFEDVLDREYEQLVGPLMESAFMYRVQILKTPDVSAAIFSSYAIRCEIAHGRRISGLPFSMTEAYEDFRRWSAQ